MPLPPDSEPPPRKYALRTPPPDSPRTDAAGNPIQVGDLLDSAARAPRPPAAMPPSAPRTPPPAANDVYAMLRDGRTRDPGPETPLPPRSTRRRNDFILLLVLGYALVAGAAWLVGPNSLVLLFAAGAAGTYTLALAWIMWFVMDHY